MLTRRKSWLRRTAVAVVVSLLVTTVWLVGKREWHRRAGNRDYAAAVAETEATDPAWRWDDIRAARKALPPERNSATVIAAVADLARLPPAGREGSLPDTPETPANVRHPAGVVAAARQALAKHRPAVDLAMTVKDYPVGSTTVELTPDIISTKIPHVDAARRAQELLTWEAALALEDADSGRAATAVAALMNTSRSIGDDPFLICQLFRMSARVTATRALERLQAQAEPTDPMLAPLQAAWAADAEEPLLLLGLRGERAVTDVTVANLADGTAAAGPEGQPGGMFERYGSWLWRGGLTRDRAFLHRYLTQAVAVARLPPHEQPAAIAALPPTRDPDMPVAGLLAPPVEKCATAFRRTTAEMRCAAAAVACERFRIKHGRWPDALADLCPAFLAAVPLDPFDGEPLRYTKVGDGVVVHSAARSVLPPAPPHPGLTDGVEIGFRLWNPDARRRPPPPDPQPDDEKQP
ncbi:MAG: hypothetical protein C0501_18600 [Isosphaera sp.]|nr:hypothetical protein [Isosphaera sp.]